MFCWKNETANDCSLRHHWGLTLQLFARCGALPTTAGSPLSCWCGLAWFGSCGTAGTTPCSLPPSWQFTAQRWCWLPTWVDCGWVRMSSFLACLPLCSVTLTCAAMRRPASTWERRSGLPIGPVKKLAQPFYVFKLPFSLLQKVFAHNYDIASGQLLVEILFYVL